MQKLKGLWMPAEILVNKDLSDKEKLILSMILYLSEENKCCFASNKYFASIVNVTANRISKIISSLNTKEYINIKLKYKTDSKEIEERQIIPLVKNINRYCKNQQEGIGENNYSDSHKQQHPIGKNNKDIIYNIKIIIIIILVRVTIKDILTMNNAIMMTSIGVAYMQIKKRLILF